MSGLTNSPRRTVIVVMRLSLAALLQPDPDEASQGHRLGHVAAIGIFIDYRNFSRGKSECNSGCSCHRTSRYCPDIYRLASGSLGKDGLSINIP
jgi:hypothetical protein